MDIGTTIIVVSALWFASEVFLTRRRRSGQADERHDKSSMGKIWVAIAIGVGTGVFLGMQGIGYLSEYAVSLQLPGIIVILAGIVLRWIAILTLKRQFTVDVAITTEHRLITHGIYRHLRHPAYAGSLLSFLGLGLAFANYLSIIVIMGCVLPAFLHRMKIEERVLAENFGDDYQRYSSSTKRLIPLLY